MKILRLIAKVGQGYNRKFQDKLIEAIYTQTGDLNEKYMPNISLDPQNKNITIAKKEDRFLFFP